MKKRSCPYFLIAALLSAVLFPGGAMAQQEDAAGNKEFEILKNLEIFSSAYKNIELVYVDEANPGEMIKSALDAMLRTLDPYTVYIPEADIEDFRDVFCCVESFFRRHEFRLLIFARSAEGS